MDMDDDTFNIPLFLSTSNCATLTHDDYADLDNEHANQYGYATKGQALDSVTWNESSGTITFDSADEVYTASGGPITCRFAVIFDETMTTPVADGLVAYSLLDNTPLDVTATDGNTLTIAMHSSGIVTYTGGQS
jgi:hypothetical protein